jgi:hypothetical protein
LFIVLGAMFMINNKSKKFFEIELLINENIWIYLCFKDINKVIKLLNWVYDKWDRITKKDECLIDGGEIESKINNSWSS